MFYFNFSNPFTFISSDVREHFIRSKWERQEFTNEYFESLSHDDCKEGFLTKSSGKDRTKRWERRWFVLTGICLAYYKKPVRLFKYFICHLIYSVFHTIIYNTA